MLGCSYIGYTINFPYLNLFRPSRFCYENDKKRNLSYTPYIWILMFKFDKIFDYQV